MDNDWNIGSYGSIRISVDCHLRWTMANITAHVLDFKDLMERPSYLLKQLDGTYGSTVDLPIPF